LVKLTRTWRVAGLLFGSGFCALVYQICWLREFRLVFGASTAASVLAIFGNGCHGPSDFYARNATAMN